MATATEVKSAIAGIIADGAKLHDIVNGGPDDTVSTKAGAVKTLAGIERDFLLNAGAVVMSQIGTHPYNFQVSVPVGTTIRATATELVMVAPSARTTTAGVTLEIAGFNTGDPRQVLRSNGSQIEQGAWRSGDRLRFYFNGSNFVLTNPLAISSGVLCEASGTADNVLLVPRPGFQISGTEQEFIWTALASNSTNVTVSFPEVFGGAATPVLLPTGEQIPPRHLRTGSEAKIRAKGANWELIEPAFYAQPMSVRLIQMNSSGVSIQARVAQPAVRLPSDLTNVTFELPVVAAAGIGSKSIEIYANDGTTQLIPAAPLYDKNGSALPADAWAANDTLRFTRDPTGFLNLISGPDRLPARIYADMGRDERGFLLSRDRPVRATFRPSLDLIEIEVRPHAAHYRNSIRRNQSDSARFSFKDTAKLNSLSGPCYILNSLTSMMGGKENNHANFLFRDIIGGSTTDTGLVPSIFEPVMKIGEFGVTPAGGYLLSGPGHAYIEYVSCSITGSLGGVSTGELVGSPEDFVFTGDRISITNVVRMMTPNGKVAGTATYAWIIEPNSGYQAVLSCTIVWSDTVEVGLRDGSYAMMMPTRDIHNMIGAGGIVSVGNNSDGQLNDPVTGDAPVLSLGNATTISCWDENNPTTRLEGLLGFGVPYRVNGVDQAFGDSAIVIDNTYGPKAYWPIGTATPVNVKGKTFTFNNRYRVVRANS